MLIMSYQSQKRIVALHNYLIFDKTYCPSGFTDTDNVNTRTPGEWRQDVNQTANWLPMSRSGSNNSTRDARSVREAWCEYFNSLAGAVSWQYNIVRSTIDPFDIVH